MTSNQQSQKFYRVYAQIVIPLMLQSMITKCVSMVDNLMVGQLGDTVIASVAMGNKLLDIIMFTILGVSASASIFIAQYYGAQNKAKQQEVFRIALMMSSSIIAISGVLFYVFPQHIVHFFVSDKTIIQQVIMYISLMLIGYVPFTFSMTYAAALKVIGQVKLPLFASLFSVFVNVGLNYVLIFGHFGFHALGIQGAAIATVIARFVEFLIIFSYTKYYRFDFDTQLTAIHHVSNEQVIIVLKKSLPLMMNEIFWAFGQATILKIYATKGSQVLAALSITDTTTAIFFAITSGIAAATPVLVSQQLGANHFERAKSNAKRLLIYAFALGCVLGIGIGLISEIVPTLYHVSPISLTYSKTMLKIVGVFFFVYLVNTQCYFIIRAGGDMLSTLIIDGGFMWCFTIPVISLVVTFSHWPIIVIYFIAQLCDVGKMIVSLTMYRRKKWVKNLTLTSNN